MQGIVMLLNLLRKGNEVADVSAWKSGQISVNSVGALLLAVAAVVKHFFGLDLGMDDATALTIGGGVIAVVNVVLTAITSKRAGILPASTAPERPSGVSNTAVEQIVPAKAP
jgi:hypothetical protein